MKIDNSGLPISMPVTAKREARAVKTDNPSGTTPLERDHQRLTKEAKELNAIFKMLNNAEVVQSERLLDIKHRMDAGTYAVSGRDVMAKLESRVHE